MMDILHYIAYNDGVLVFLMSFFRVPDSPTGVAIPFREFASPFSFLLPAYATDYLWVNWHYCVLLLYD